MPPVPPIIRTIVGSHDHSQDLACLVMKDFEFLSNGRKYGIILEFDHTLQLTKMITFNFTKSDMQGPEKFIGLRWYFFSGTTSTPPTFE